jgi:hypothetical protein
MWRSLRLVLSEKAFCERLSSLSAVKAMQTTTVFPS